MRILPRFAQAINTNRKKNQSVTQCLYITDITTLYLQETRPDRFSFTFTDRPPR
jgi:hypothetical protein